MALSRIGFRGPVKAAVQTPHARRGAAASRGAYLPSRLRVLLRELGTSGGRLAASDAVLRALAGAGTPDGVARDLVGLASGWFGGTGWALLGVEEARGLTWLADRGIVSTRRPAVTAVASRVVDNGRPAWCDDASRLGPSRTRRPFAVLALPLRSAGRVVGVLAGIDPPAAAPGGQGTLPGDAALAPLWLLLDPLAGALDAAMRLGRAERLSSIDDLTGLFNSRYLAGALQREAKRAVRSHRPLSVLFVDLDGFKGINDRWGHLCGSRALVEAAERIQSGARETDVVARYGGDEFAIVLPDTPSAGAMVVAQRVRERIAGHAFLEDEGIGYRLTASVGAATLLDSTQTPEELLHAADAAMYRVKARGKDGIEFAASPAGAR